MLPLPITFDLPLPKLSQLPKTTILAASMGYLYGKLTDVSDSLLCAKIFAIMQLANSTLFLLGEKLFKMEDSTGRDVGNMQRRMLLAGTTILTQAIGILAMRHFDIIGKTGTICWSLFALGMSLRQIIQSFEDTKFLSIIKNKSA